jgi:hypothetical protein
MAKSDRDVVILLAVVLVSTAFVTWLLGGFVVRSVAEDRRPVEEPPISKYEEHLLALDREALDVAYKDHIKLVFGIWMKGPSDPDSPRRAGTGARNAREGYNRSMERIEERERRAKEMKPK